MLQQVCTAHVRLEIITVTSLHARINDDSLSDMVRIPDARMSGTAYGTVVLHCAQEAATGGPLALVQNGNLITLDVEARTLSLPVNEIELQRRRADWEPALPKSARGYVELYIEHVLQANEGADLNFLVGGSGSAVGRNNF